MPGSRRSFSWSQHPTYLRNDSYFFSNKESRGSHCSPWAIPGVLEWFVASSIGSHIIRYKCGQTSCLRYRHTVTLRRVCAVIVGVWLLSALTYTGVIFFVNKIAYYFTRGTFIFLVMISVVISAFSYIKIFVSLRRQQAQIQQEQTYGARQSQLNIARYKKTVYTIAWVQLALLVCYAPYGIALLIGLAINIPHSSTEMKVAWLALLTLLFSNSSFNPVLYCWKIRDVRQEVKNIFHEVCCCSD